MSSIHVARQGFVTKSALPSVSRERGSTTVADNSTVLLLNGNGANAANNNTFLTENFGTSSARGNYSIYVDGTGDSLGLPSNAALTPANGAFTFETWFYGSFPVNSTFFLTAGTGGLQIGRRDTGGDWGIAANGVAWRITSTTLPSANQWNHIAVVRSGTGTNQTSLFLNGTRVANGTLTDNFPQGAVTLLGAAISGHVSNFRFVKGTAVYDPTQTTLTQPTAPLTAISGTSLLIGQNQFIQDNSSNAFPITISGDARVSVNTSPTTEPVAITRNGNATQGSYSPFTLPDGQWSNFFDGTGDYLTVPSDSATTFNTGAFTIEFWLYASSLSSTQGLVSKGTVASSTNWQVILENTGRISFAYNNLTSFTCSTTLSTNTWYHVAVVGSAANIVVYLNGVQDGSVTYAYNYSQDSVLRVGVNRGTSSYVNGYISNVRVVKGTAVYTSNFTPPTTPLTAISGTSLLTCQSNRFVDNSSNNFAITRNGDIRVTPWSPFAPTSAYDPATNGGSGYFDGTGDRLQIPSNTALQVSSSDFTLESWVYLTALPASGSLATIAQKGLTGTSNFEISFRFNNNAGVYTLELATTGDGTTLTTASSSSLALATNTWYHCAVTKTGTTATFWINGVSVGTGTVNSSIIAGSADFCIGDNSSGNRPITGYLSNLRLVKGTAVYTSAFTPPTAPVTNITNTSLLLNFTNAGIFDTAGDNVIETVGNAQIDTAIKKYGSGSLEFDGTGDYLTVPANQLIDLSTGDFTFEFWAYPTTRTNSVDSVFGYGSFTMMLYHNSSNNWVLEVGNGSSNYFSITTSRDLNVWTHLAITRSGNTFTLWKNGVSAGTASNSGAVALSARSLFIGVNSNGGNQIFTGYIDDFRITRGFARYTSTFTPPTAELAIFGTVPNIVNNSTYGVYQLA